eukprot:Polyplicarium_translucidae@DN4872_c0_g1_i1.p1
MVPLIHEFEFPSAPPPSATICPTMFACRFALLAAAALGYDINASAETPQYRSQCDLAAETFGAEQVVWQAAASASGYNSNDQWRDVRVASFDESAFVVYIRPD